MKICFTGDSISAGDGYSINQPRSVGDYMAYQLKNTLSRNITYPSDGITQQTTRWNQISTEEKLTFDFIISMNVFNNTVSQIVSLYPAFFSLVRSEIKPLCKIIQLTRHPYGGAAGLAEREAKNAALLALSGIDVFVTEHATFLDDGNNNVKTVYNASITDTLHLNTSGREIVADSIIQKMKELNWI